MKRTEKQTWAEEPWRAMEGSFFIKGEEGWGSIVSAQEWFIAKMEDSLDPEANARRITSAVNAVAGMDPAVVPEAVEVLRSCHRLLQELRRADLPPPVQTRVADLEASAAAVLARLILA